MRIACVLTLVALMAHVGGPFGEANQGPQAAGKSSADAPAAASSARRVENYIGVFTEPVSEALQTQFSEMLTDGQGLVVRRVLKNSPAAAAGVSPFDVLATLNQQPISDVGRLRVLLGQVQAGATVRLRLIRNARPVDVEVTVRQRRSGRIPRSAAGIQQRTSAADSKSVKVGPDGVQTGAAAGRTATNYSVSVSSEDGMHYQLEVKFVDDAGKRQNRTLKGTADQLRIDVQKLPRIVADDVLRSLNQVSQPARRDQALRLRLQPRLDGRQQLLRVSMHQPGRRGAVRLLEFEHNFGDVARIDVDELLKFPPLKAQLEDLSPDVRSRIEATLKKMEVPRIQVEVKTSE